MNRYFKGYYFKCAGADRSFALIPALHADENKSKASLQLITDDKVYVIPYPDINFSNREFKIKIGNNYFSEKGMYLDVDYEKCQIHGKLKFGRFQNIQYDIMGPFQYIPYMQCKHSVISMSHSVTGKVYINDTKYFFQNGIGYIEGDRGRSFPKEYIWTQCHWSNISLMLAVADIPLLGFSMEGIIGVVMIGNQEYRIATYLGAKLLSISEDKVVIKQGRYILFAQLIEENHQRLNAPVRGRMIRTIHESISCKAYYKFTYNDRILFEFTSAHASFEHEINCSNQN